MISQTPPGAVGTRRVLAPWLGLVATLLLVAVAILWPMLTDLTGLVALSAMVCTFLLVCRLRALSRAAGWEPVVASDALSLLRPPSAPSGRRHEQRGSE